MKPRGVRGGAGQRMVDETIADIRTPRAGHPLAKIEHRRGLDTTFRFYTESPHGTSFGTKFEGLPYSMGLSEQVEGLYHAGSVGIIMSGWVSERELRRGSRRTRWTRASRPWRVPEPGHAEGRPRNETGDPARRLERSPRGPRRASGATMAPRAVRLPRGSAAPRPRPAWEVRRCSSMLRTSRSQRSPPPPSRPRAGAGAAHGRRRPRVRRPPLQFVHALSAGAAVW